MKKSYQSPKALIIKIQTNRGLLLSTSETVISGNRGGWVKEQAGNDNTTITDKSVWDNEW